MRRAGRGEFRHRISRRDGRLRHDRPIGHQRDRRARARRLSTFFAGGFLLFLIVVLGDWVKQIPMAALVAVMIMVSISTFNWASIKNMRSHPLRIQRRDAGDRHRRGVDRRPVDGRAGRRGVERRVFRRQGGASARRRPSSHPRTAGYTTYLITGQVFFASSNSLVDAIDYQDVPERVRIDVSQAHFWDITAIGALDDIVLKLRRHGADGRGDRFKPGERDHGGALRHPSPAGRGGAKAGALISLAWRFVRAFQLLAPAC